MRADITTLCKKLRGKFLSIDGPDGAGKSTQRQLLADTLEAAGAEIVSCRDPGGTEIGERIRSVLLDYDLSTMDISCETLLFMASRAQLVREIIRPALESNKTVLCDRFVTSTCAYQGAAGYDPKRVIELARFAIDESWPDLTVILDVDVDEGFKRIGRKPHHSGGYGKDDLCRSRRTAGETTLFQGSRPDAMEARSIDFHRRVREIFLNVQEYYPRPVITVDGRGDVDTVHQRILEALLGVAQ